MPAAFPLPALPYYRLAVEADPPVLVGAAKRPLNAEEITASLAYFFNRVAYSP